MEEFNLFDIVIISIVLISCLIAFFRGFIVSFLSFGNWLISIILTYLLFPKTKEFLSKFIENEIAIVALSGFGMFFLLSIVFGIVNYKVAYLIRRYIDGMVDKTLGIMFGLTRGIIICSVAFFVINTVSKSFEIGDDASRPGPDFFVNSKVYGLLKLSTNALVSYIPSDILNESEEALDTLQTKAKETINEIEAQSEENLELERLGKKDNKALKGDDVLLDFYNKGVEKTKKREGKKSKENDDEFINDQINNIIQKIK